MMVDSLRTGRSAETVRPRPAPCQSKTEALNMIVILMTRNTANSEPMSGLTSSPTTDVFVSLSLYFQTKV